MLRGGHLSGLRVPNRRGTTGGDSASESARYSSPSKRARLRGCSVRALRPGHATRVRLNRNVTVLQSWPPPPPPPRPSKTSMLIGLLECFRHVTRDHGLRARELDSTGQELEHVNSHTNRLFTLSHAPPPGSLFVPAGQIVSDVKWAAPRFREDGLLKAMLVRKGWPAAGAAAAAAAAAAEGPF